MPAYQEEKQGGGAARARPAGGGGGGARPGGARARSTSLKRVQYRVELEEERRQAGPRPQSTRSSWLRSRSRGCSACANWRWRSSTCRRTRSVSSPSAAMNARSVARGRALPGARLCGRDAHEGYERVRHLGHALRNAGLNGTEYARDVILARSGVGPRRPSTCAVLTFTLRP